MKQSIEILMSCMHQKDTGIVQRSAIKTNVVVVNQCDIDSVQNETLTDENGVTHNIKFISTTERGLSRSRNMAVKNASSDICIIADDDEMFVDGYAQIISKAYEEYPNADIIAFKICNSGKTYPEKPEKIWYLGALKVASLEITFRRKSIIDKNILFDEEMGSGTGHGGGEENKFLYDCLHKGLKIQYVPKTIATLDETSGSQWFNGYTEQFFYNRGWQTKRFMGTIPAILYAFYYVIKKRSEYCKDIGSWTALRCTLKGIFVGY